MKSGEKTSEKYFLGYEFSKRRNNEGIHPIQRGKTVDECTQMYDSKVFDNPEKASTYILKAFTKPNEDFTIDTKMQNYVSYTNLVDMISFIGVSFEKKLSIITKKSITIESKWELKKISEVAEIIRGVTYSKEKQSPIPTKSIILTADNITVEGKFKIKKEVYLNEDYKIDNLKKLKKEDIFICFSSGSKKHLGKVALIEQDTNYFAGGFMGIIRVNETVKSKFIYELLNGVFRQAVRDTGSGSNINNLSGLINDIQIPIPPINIQKKIVEEIEILEKKAETIVVNDLETLKESIIKKYLV